MPRESQAHEDLKRDAKKMLMERYGFPESQISEDYRSGLFIVDVAGIRPGLKIAVEVGMFPSIR